jgi:polyphosphate glucokinase
MRRAAIGIDVGGTGIKGAAVDLATGERLTSRHRVATPAGGKPAEIVAEVGAMVAAIRAELAAGGLGPAAERVGVALPAVVKGGTVCTAANIDASWIGVDAVALLSEATGSPCRAVNDADAAAVAETALGAAMGAPGLTMVLTFGTGIGSGCVFDGVLIPNFELGHLQLDGYEDIERHAGAKTIEREGISLEEWADRAARYVRHLELLMHPDRFVLGGSISKIADRYLPFEGVSAPVVPARFRNNAGILGAALLAANEH